MGLRLATHSVLDFTISTELTQSTLRLIRPMFPSFKQNVHPMVEKGTCVGLDTGRTGRFETSFFNNLRIGRGVLLSDQLLWEDASTRHFVRRLLGARGSPPLNFHVEFGRSMVKTSNIGVKTGFAGEIRRVCSSVN